MNAPISSMVRGLFETALNEAVQKIQPGAAPVFYCEELDGFVGPDGRKYVIEITVRPETD